jgi:dienelactone hydrolase
MVESIHLFAGGTMLRYLTALLLLSASLGAHAAVVGKEVLYHAGPTELKGYLAWDDAVHGRRPGVLVVHEWWGQNAYARKRADMLAALGYTALALDMYGDGKTADHPADAGKFSGAVRRDLPLMTARFNAARKLLAAQDTVDPKRIAAIGYCFGGSVVLEMARSGASLAGVASFHGSLSGLGPIAHHVTAKVLVANGADDPFNPPDQVRMFRDDMDAAGVDYRFINYPGAKHSFTNPGATALGKKFNLPLEYNADADRESWQALQDFLTRIFR